MFDWKPHGSVPEDDSCPVYLGGTLWLWSYSLCYQCGQSTHSSISEAFPEGFCQSIPYHCWDLKKQHVERVQQISFHNHLMCLVPKQLQLILFGLANTNYPIIILAFQPCLHWLVCALERENADIVMKIRKRWEASKRWWNRFHFPNWQNGCSLQLIFILIEYLVQREERGKIRN